MATPTSSRADEVTRRGEGWPSYWPDRQAEPPRRHWPEFRIVLALAVPAVVVAALAGSIRFRRLAFPAIMLLTVLDAALLVAGGAALT